MHVKANGDITVLGFVESGTIHSKGAVTIMLGAIGRKKPQEKLMKHLVAT